MIFLYACMIFNDLAKRNIDMSSRLSLKRITQLISISVGNK